MKSEMRGVGDEHWRSGKKQREWGGSSQRNVCMLGRGGPGGLGGKTIERWGREA